MLLINFTSIIIHKVEKQAGNSISDRNSGIKLVESKSHKNEKIFQAKIEFLCWKCHKTLIKLRKIIEL